MFFRLFDKNDLLLVEILSEDVSFCQMTLSADYVDRTMIGAETERILSHQNHCLSLTGFGDHLYRKLFNLGVGRKLQFELRLEKDSLQVGGIYLKSLICSGSFAGVGTQWEVEFDCFAVKSILEKKREVRVAALSKGRRIVEE